MAATFHQNVPLCFYSDKRNAVWRWSVMVVWTDHYFIPALRTAWGNKMILQRCWIQCVEGQWKLRGQGVGQWEFEGAECRTVEGSGNWGDECRSVVAEGDECRTVAVEGDKGLEAEGDEDSWSRQGIIVLLVVVTNVVTWCCFNSMLFQLYVVALTCFCCCLLLVDVYAFVTMLQVFVDTCWCYCCNAVYTVDTIVAMLLLLMLLFAYI